MTARLPQLVDCTDTLNFRGVITDQHRRNLVFDATHLRTTLGRNSAYSCNIVYADMKFFFDLIVVFYSLQTGASIETTTDGPGTIDGAQHYTPREPVALAVEAKASASFA
ncbi:hypothetical protein COCC4DRAFT_151836 [Bipolaris maydis ATCC 48331]|uniref:Uncharacterized protein n=2 Tax=Cochliobolus heterostrophus TaxID=5016 RepID=M2UC36_COCH5|nr:uncharacterized protein COCC4DRAFT_151836 [Bipolaris maydis ATCC 48331]EMD85558.1 hypothetical protein COCHEDRAFT_1207869 [Bipolaris maydis C5]ENH99988.1 hypothetical protein COCC4DRAFT_151836 [Bipolaris maydis ATCC 48331]KAH7559101.1 hypothetical protein BM1_04038 [Bipolaris maydis]